MKQTIFSRIIMIITIFIMIILIIIIVVMMMIMIVIKKMKNLLKELTFTSTRITNNTYINITT